MRARVSEALDSSEFSQRLEEAARREAGAFRAELLAAVDAEREQALSVARKARAEALKRELEVDAMVRENAERVREAQRAEGKKEKKEKKEKKKSRKKEEECEEEEDEEKESGKKRQGQRLILVDE